MEKNEAAEGGGLGNDGFLVGENEEEEKMGVFWCFSLKNFVLLSSKSSDELQNQVIGVVKSSQESYSNFLLEEAMDENETAEGGGLGHGHKNEAISAVAGGWGFLVEEEEDDDYEDLNNNINVGENEEEEKAVELHGGSDSADVPAVVVEVKVENEENLVSRISRGVENASSNVVNQRPTADSTGDLGNAGNVGNSGNDNVVRQGMDSENATGSIGSVGGTILFVSELHWWTTDAQVEEELSSYGAVKEVIFFNEIATGKSKGYCQAEFYEPAAATACKERMNEHVFNGQACVVTFASPDMVKRLDEAWLNRINQQNARQTAPVNAQAWLGPDDTAGGNNNNAKVGNFQGGGDNNRGLDRAGPRSMGNSGPVSPMRNRVDGVVGRGIMENAGGGLGQGIGAASPLINPQTMMGRGFDPAVGGPMGNAGGGFRQGIGAASSSIHPQTMMGQVFDPAFRGPMGRMGGYGGFPGGLTPPFSRMLPSFPPVGRVRLPGVAPCANPVHYGRIMPMNSMGMMPHAGMEGPNMGMCSDPNMGGWAGDEHGYRAGESNYVTEPVFDYRYGEENRDRGPWPTNRENVRGSERDRPSYSDKRYIDDRYDRDIARDMNTGRDHDWQERKRQDDRDVGSSRDRVRDLERHQDRKCKRGHHRDDRDSYADRHRDDRDRNADRHRDDRDRNDDRHRDKDRDKEHDDEQDRGRSSRTHAKSRSRSKGKAPLTTD